jgi:hypothetical protein
VLLYKKLKIKYELSYQSTTRLKYIDKSDQLLIIHQQTVSFIGGGNRGTDLLQVTDKL